MIKYMILTVLILVGSLIGTALFLTGCDENANAEQATESPGCEVVKLAPGLRVLSAGMFGSGALYLTTVNTPLVAHRTVRVGRPNDNSMWCYEVIEQ